MMLEMTGTVDDFFAAIKAQQENEKQCVALRTCPTSVMRGLDQASLRSIVSGSRLGPDRIRVISDGEVLNNRLFRKYELPSDDGNLKVYALDVHLFNQAMDFGAVLALDSISEFDNFARYLATKISRTFEVRSSANLYLATSKKRSFGGHRDDHDFIAVQIEGEKNWNLEDVTAPRKPDNLPEPDHLMPYVTTPGTFLYVPHGFWHDPVANGASSTHVTFSIVYPNWYDFTSFVQKAITQDPQYKTEPLSPDTYHHFLGKFYQWWKNTIEFERNLNAQW